MAETYKGDFYCTNCGWEGAFNIPKGTTKGDYTQKQTCPTCGTLRLQVS